MTGRLFSLLIIFALGGGVFAGTPLRSGAEDCAMSQQMDCCKRAAKGQATSEEITKANLCRTLFCDHSGATSANVQTPQFTSVLFAAAYLKTLNFLPSKTKQFPKTQFRAQPVTRENNPLYLQNLSFRI